MSHITLATPQPGLVGFKDQLANTASQTYFNEEANQRGSGFGKMGMLQSTSFSAGASGSCANIASKAGTHGVVSMTVKLTGTGGQSAAVGYGYYTTTRPIILSTTQRLLFQVRMITNSIQLWTGTTRYIFMGIDDCTGITSPHTNAIGFKVDNTSFQGDRFVASPITRAAGVETKSNPPNAYFRKSTDTGDVARTYMFDMYYQSGAWKVDFYKLWETGTTVGSAGQWINLATHTTNIPSTAVLAPNIHDITISSSIGASGSEIIRFDYLSARIIDSVKRF